MQFVLIFKKADFLKKDLNISLIKYNIPLQQLAPLRSVNEICMDFSKSLVTQQHYLGQ